MKKIITLFVFSLFIVMPFSVKAETKYGYSNVTGSGFSIRSNANSTASVIGYLYGGVNVEIVASASGNGCGTWYKIKFNNGYGWVCGISKGGAKNVELYTTQTLRTNNRTAETDYEKTLQKAGFPSSYWDKLSALHKAHPNWNFIADKTGRDWSYATWAETGAVSDGDIDKSLLYAYNNNTDLIAGYLKTDTYNYKTNKFTMQDSGGFYAARKEMVAYYMDPRNFLNENFIFQFEVLSFNSTYHTKSIIENIFDSGYLNKYASNYVSAGKSKNVSAVHLATRSVQEGLNTSNFATTGAEFIYSGSLYTSIQGQKFSKCFNFFNIGAYSDNVSALQNAGVYACGGVNKNETDYGRPWNSVDKALLGGAEILGNNYIASGQDTLYFQKYNTASYTKSALYGHQFMSNISAVAYEGSDTYDSYYADGLISSAAFTFVIPVYNNMPEKTSLPSSLSPNNYLTGIQVDGTSINNFDGNKTEGYKLNVVNSKTTVSIRATTVVDSAKVTINNGNSISLNVGDNKIPILVTAANGEKRTYYITITREEASNGSTTAIETTIKNAGYKIIDTYIGNISLNNTLSTINTKIKNQNSSANISLKDKSGNNKANNNVLATGDKLTITIGNEEKTYEIYVYGDVNGDGLAKATDYMLIKNHIMTNKKLSGAYKLAADVNKDGNVKATDYMLIKNYIMKGISF